MLARFDRQTENLRLEASRAAMAAVYPHFEFAYRLAYSRAGDPYQVGVWRGTLSPFGNDHLEVLADLDRDRCVLVSTNGRLKHDVGCRDSHSNINTWAGSVLKGTEFEVSVHYSGGIAHPEARVMKPRLAPGSAGHLNGDGTICAYLASDDAWRADRDTVAKFLDHVAIWTAKRIVWDAAGYWPGTAYDPDIDVVRTAQWHLETLKPGMQCPCRSGLSYDRCHRVADAAVANVRVL
jgi:hypothetical protein